MIRKIISVLIIGVLLLTGLAGLSVTGNKANKKVTKDILDNISKSIDERFNESDVFIFGRCRSIIVFYDNPQGPEWIGGLYIGKLFATYVSMCDYNDEWMIVLIRNETNNTRFFKFRGRMGMGCKNTSGYFYWGAKGNGIKLLAPRIFIKCYAERVYVTQDWEI